MFLNLNAHVNTCKHLRQHLKYLNISILYTDDKSCLLRGRRETEKLSERLEEAKGSRFVQVPETASRGQGGTDQAVKRPQQRSKKKKYCNLNLYRYNILFMLHLYLYDIILDNISYLLLPLFCTIFRSLCEWISFSQVSHDQCSE